MVTVTAFAVIDVNYSVYGGKYRSDTSSKPGYISISESRIGLVVFWDNVNQKFLSGSTDVGYITFPSSCPFYAKYDTVNIVDENGVPIDCDPNKSGIQIETIPDYEVKGGVVASGKKNIISARQTYVRYVQV